MLKQQSCCFHSGPSTIEAGVVGLLFELSGLLRAQRTSDEPTHPEPSRPLVGRLLDLHPLQRHVVDGTFLDFLPPVLHRALEMKQKESFNTENFHRRRFVKIGIFVVLFKAEAEARISCEGKKRQKHNRGIKTHQ